MSVIAVCTLDSVFDNGVAYLRVSGMSVDATVDFTGNENGTIALLPNWNSATINADIQAAVATRLQSAPYSMTFGVGDTVLLLPA
jgi:hypothetical protein